MKTLVEQEIQVMSPLSKFYKSTSHDLQENVYSVRNMFQITSFIMYEEQELEEVLGITMW